MRMHSQDNVGGALRPDISRPIPFRVHSCVSWANPSAPHPQRGSLILVVLCLLAVLGIALASFLAIGNQSMKLSNRSYRTSVSAQLAEIGLEEALRAFNANNWADWTTSGTSADWSTSGTAATCTITFPATKFGQGVTGTAKIRVDNYNANHLGSAWSSSKIYRIGDQVGYTGVWYSCVQNHSNQAPTANNWTYWVPSHVPWRWSTRTYKVEEMVNHNGAWYRCTVAHTNQEPPNASYWQYIPSVSFYPSIDYTTDAILHWSGNIWYQKTSTSWSNTPGITWRYRTGYTYYFNDLVYYNAVWYRFINSTPTASITPGSNAAYWENALTGNVHTWASSSINYNLGDAVYYSSTSQWYRCILAHTSSGSVTPTNTTYWTNTPLLSNQWESDPYYSTNDLVTYNGVWYRCISSHTSSSSILPTNTSYWIGANTSDTSYTWNATSNYSAGAYRCYGGAWYKCLSAGSNKSPNNSSYWTASWDQSSGVTTGASVIYAEGSVTLPDGSPAIKTQLRALISPAPLFPNAAAATANLTITSGTGTVNSYDSVTDPTASTPGYSAVLAAGSTLAINGTTAVSGYLAWPSPPSGISTDTTVWGASSPPSPKVDLTRVSRSPFIPDFDVRHVSKGLSLATITGVTLGTPGATTPSTYYYTGDLDMNAAAENITINGPVILYISGQLRIRSNSGARILINPTGSLRLHVARDFRVDASGGGIVNNTNDPKALSVLLSRAGADTFNYSEPNSFYGTIYLPDSTSTFTIATGATFYGAISVKNLTFSTEANVHYDTSLRYATFTGVDQPWAVTEWRELSATEQATMP